VGGIDTWAKMISFSSPQSLAAANEDVPEAFNRTHVQGFDDSGVIMRR
jgi:hypothetical protein